MRVFFTSDRQGGLNTWWVRLTAAGVPGPLTGLPADPAEHTAPVAVTGPTGAVWLASRSDRSLVASQTGILPPPGSAGRHSERVPDAGALRLRAGGGTVTLKHATRNLGRAAWGELLTYTPEYPHLVAEDAPSRTHRYTRRTIGLFLRQSRNGEPITQAEIRRLLTLLRRFLPINLRVVLIVAPEPLFEFVYGAGAGIDITDAWSDDVPVVEIVGGGLGDGFAVAAPDFRLFMSNDPASRTFAQADLTTLRNRTWTLAPI